MQKSTIGAQLYTLRDHAKTPEDLRTTLRKVREIGYETVQVSGIGPIEPEKLKELVQEADLSVCATHISFDRLKEDLDGVIRDHKLWDCRYVGVGSMPSPYRADADGYRRFAAEASDAAKKLSEAGLQLIYHNHKFEFEKFDGSRTGMDILLEESDPSLGFELDMYWVQAGGANPVNWIHKVKGRMAVVHLKDMAIVQDQQVFAELGEGNMNWYEIIAACRETSVEWYVVEQDVCRRDPFESLDISLRHLHTLL
ncbi:sugar phosphate isomerase/epimerase [Paenibacillus aurantius]|uniref:Sugar phosphate isomerase/epimerase n=1 Tax=Paenibacillus aurantius TaxID=2918900 RepID=A0AA96REA8_9BACL|nr:sugar phosphate isomerase/epimerase [Paenibacillus aurantius]WNQ10301.1 sugar phosphate isomerase/epimerase [Paenibacillus aurantius]